MAASASGPTIRDILSSYFTGKTIKASLHTAGYVFDPDTHAFRSSLSNEVSGTGYTAGGITLTGVNVLALDAANNRAKLDADDANFGVVTLSGVTQIVTYISTGSVATDRILSVHTFTAQSPASVNFTYAWSADGIGYLTY